MSSGGAVPLRKSVELSEFVSGPIYELSGLVVLLVSIGGAYMLGNMVRIGNCGPYTFPCLGIWSGWR